MAVTAPAASIGPFVQIFPTLSLGIAGSGNPPPVLDAFIGPAIKFTATSTNITFSGLPNSTQSTCTLAAILVVTSTNVATKYFCSTTGNNVTSAYNLLISTAALEAKGGGTTLNPSITLVAGHSYFVAMSMKSGNSQAIAVDLRTGQVLTGSSATTYTASGGNGVFEIGAGGATTTASNTEIAAIAWSTAYLSAAQLAAWGADPWSFWYPPRQIAIGSVIAAGPTLNVPRRMFLRR